MAVSETSICNLGLQIIGAARIASIDDDSVNARNCKACFADLRDAELRAHPWNFAIRRERLTASATPPVFGRARAFPLPSDFLKALPPYLEDDSNTRDWKFEGGEILTDDLSPLDLRYVARITDASKFDPGFVMALAAKIAEQIAPTVSKSNELTDRALRRYNQEIARAKRNNALDGVPQDAVTDSWITARA